MTVTSPRRCDQRTVISSVVKGRWLTTVTEVQHSPAQS
jgi:hypothetical protein